MTFNSNTIWKVWLPLSNGTHEVNQANRIILNFPSRFYPISNFIFLIRLRNIFCYSLFYFV